MVMARMRMEKADYRGDAVETKGVTGRKRFLKPGSDPKIRKYFPKSGSDPGF
jgi:hypothetical protein